MIGIARQLSLLSSEDIALIKLIILTLAITTLFILPRVKWLSIRKLLHAALALAGILSLLLWWNLGRFNFPERFHYPELFHYYLGAQYFEELGYENLYHCAVVAAEQNGVIFQSEQTVRELRDNTFTTIQRIGEDSKRCTALFSQTRWQEFRAAVSWFHTRLNDDWQRVVLDHGFNATPFWILIAHQLIADRPPSTELFSQIVLIDEALIVTLWCALLFTFPFSAWSCAAVFWGTTALSGYSWTGGAFLRHDWLLLLVIGIASLRKRYWSLAGVALALSSALRVFPLVTFAAVFISLCRASNTKERQPLFRLLSSAAFSLALIGILTIVSIDRPAPVQEFFKNLDKHSNTRTGNALSLNLALTNIAACQFGDNSRENKCLLEELPQKNEVSQPSRLGIKLFCLVGALLVVFISGIFLPPWQAAALSLAALPLASSFSSYYAEAFLLIALFAGDSRQPSARGTIASSAAISLLIFSLLTRIILVDNHYSNKAFLAASVLFAMWISFLMIEIVSQRKVQRIPAA